MKKIMICKTCGGYTKHKFVGRDKLELDSLEKAFSVINIGMYPIVKRVLEPPAKYYECERCNNIVRIKK